ncbi:MAG TPA: transcriptional regulator NrdR [Longimicrobium sp.]|uniref:transcriptional regulator NrdR n=1 Tax=Longimicrobium sp. TaxID=2029185 RepID=UPI002EDA9FD2
MRCPFCHHTDDRVVDSRSVRDGRAVRRRRECLRCERRFTTYEYIEERPLQVLKRDGEREPYDRRKLLASIRTATAKRPISPTEIDGIVEDIERELDRRESGEAESQDIGQMVMDRLKTRDHIAYVRFASVYRNFQDPEEFYHEFRDLADRQAQREMRHAHYELPLDPPAGAEGPPAGTDEHA